MPALAEPVRVWGVEYSASKRTADSDRVVSASETLQRIQPVLRSAGITRLANITGLDRLGLPVALAIRPNSASITTSAGKGLTLDAAMVSAAMEGIEVFHAETLHPDYDRISYRHLAARHSVVPLELIRLRKNAFFNPDWPHDWLLGWDLLSQTSTAVPYNAVSLRPSKSAHDFAVFESTSNGLASGNNLLEAILSGLLEVVERDAVSCFQFRTRRYTAPLFTPDDETLSPLLEQLRREGVEVLLQDCRSDIDIPVYAAYLYDRRLPQLGVYHGYGAHLNSTTAVQRAILEAVQSRAVYIAGSRDDCFHEDFQFLRHPRHAINQAALLKQPQRTRAAAPVCNATQTLQDDIATILNRLQKSGITQVIVVDLSRNSFPVKVAKVIVPGLEGHFGELYRPGPRARKELQIQ